MRFVIFALLTAGSLFSQQVLGPKRAAVAASHFESSAGESPLKCEVRTVRPQLNFSFRFQAGYVVQVPMRQYSGNGHRWAVLTRVTPLQPEGTPVYLASAQQLPDIPSGNKVWFELAGGFLLGEGKYAVDWLIMDDANRVCRKKWQVEAKPKRNERGIELGMRAGTVDDISLTNGIAGRPEIGSSQAGRRITVLLHAAPLLPGRVRLRSYDRVLLLSSLSSLMERLPGASLRLVAFNLDQQKEVFRQDNFNRRAFLELARRLNDIELGLVDYSVLKNRRGHVDLMADLVNEQVEASPAADAVVVLGPTARYSDKVPKSVLEESSGIKPKFFYFQYKPYWIHRADFPDTITFAVKRIGGKVSTVRTPADFGKALAQLTEALQRGG